MNPCIGLPEDRDNQRIGGIRSRQLHVVGELIGGNALQDELAGIGVFPLVAFQRHVAQAEADRGKEHDYNDQQNQWPEASSPDRAVSLLRLSAVALGLRTHNVAKGICAACTAMT